MYHILAQVYDEMQDVDYQAFADYYQKVFARFDCRPQLILDLGCGTGAMTMAMAERGYEMIGLDASSEMLEIASAKGKEAGLDILYLLQDMTAFELYGTVGAMICALDGVNYLTEDGQLEKMLRLLHYYLDPGGLLIFDINTPYKFREILDGNSFVYDCDDAYCVWSNEYEEAEKRCYFDLNFFLKNPDGSYRRMDEYQEERVYEIPELKEAVEACKLEWVGVFDHLSFAPPREDSERVFVVVRRPV